MHQTNLFQLPHMEIWEFTPRAGLEPPKGIGKGTVVQASGDLFKDKKYYYKWDGLHDGGEWEVYSKSNGVHVGVLDPATGTWHSKKGAKKGRSIMVFAVLARSSGAIAFGPILLDEKFAVGNQDRLERVDRALHPALVDAIESLGFYMPVSLYWNLLIGVNPTPLELQLKLIDLMEENSKYWGSKSVND